MARKQLDKLVTNETHALVEYKLKREHLLLEFLMKDSYIDTAPATVSVASSDSIPILNSSVSPLTPRSINWAKLTVSEGRLTSIGSAEIRTDLSIANRNANTLDIVSSSGDDVTIPAATTTLAGLLTANQFNIIDTIDDTYVPYINATDNVDLGYKKITSKKQLLPLFNGACSIPTIIDNGNGTITVGDGEYHLSTRVDGKGTESFIIVGGIFSLIDNTTNYLVADYNFGTPILKIVTDVSVINETSIIPVYTAYRNGNYLHFQNWDSLGVALANKIHQSIVKTQRYRRESGLALAEYPTRYLTLSSGVVWIGAVSITLDAISTNTDNLRLFYHSNGVWTTSVQSQYNNTQYDNGTDLVTLTSNRYAVNWIFRGVENQKHLYIILGTGDYTLSQAQNAKLPAVPSAISSHSILVGKIIIQRDATITTSIQSAFDTQFSQATINVHNDLIGRDTVDVHPSSSISFSPSGTLTGTTVYQALTQLDSHDISSIGVSGADTKTITLTKHDGNTLTATFTIEGLLSYPTTGIVVSSGSAWSPSISVGNGYLQNNGSNIYSWNYPEITSLRSTGATNGYVATSNGSGGIELRQPSINVTSFIKQKSIVNLYNFAHSSVVYNDMLFIGERKTDPKIVKWANINDLNTVSSITISGVGSSVAGLETGFYVSSIGKICFIARNNTSGFDIVEVDPNTMAYTQHNFPGITGLSAIGGTDGTYIYFANYNSFHKIRVSDWTDVASAGLPSGLSYPHSIQVNTARNEFYVTGSGSNPIYLAKVSTSDLSSTSIDLSSYVSYATDDMFFYDDGTSCKLFICGEQNISGQPFGGVIVNTIDNSLTQLKLNPSYGLFRDGVKAYSCGINGNIQTFSVLDPTNISTFPMTGFIPNEVLATSSGRTFFTNWDSYNSVMCEFFVPVPMPNANNLVTSVFGRTGDVVANTGDYTASQVTNAAATNAANIFTTDQTITGANTNIIVKTDASTGSGLLVKDGSNFNKISIGWNQSTSEGFIWTYGGSNLPIKIGTNGTERWRFKTDGVFETINLSSFPSASRSGFGGFFTYNNLPYFINSSGVTTQLGAGGGSMIYPSGTGLAVVNSGSSWGTTIALSGNSGQFLNGNGVFTTPTFSSQWTTDANGYGISYASNVGIGNSSSNVAGLAVYKNIDTGYAGYFSNTSSSAFGVSIVTGSNGSQPILNLVGNTSTPRFDFKSDGSMYAYSLTNVDQSYILGYNNSTGQITYLPKPSGGGGSGTVTSFSSSNLSPLFTTSVSNATTTPALSFSAVSQAQNLVYASPNGSSGIPSFRKVVVGDISGNSSSTYNFLRADGSWTNYLTSANSAPLGYTLKVENTSNGTGLIALGSTGAAVTAYSTGYYGLNAQSDSRAAARFGIFPTSTNSIETVMEIYRNTSGTAAAGIGSRIFFSNQTADGNSHVSGDAYFENVLTNATNTSTRSSEFIWRLGTSGNAPLERMRLLSAGTSTIGAVLKLAPCDAAPSSPTEGMIYSNSTDHHLYFYNGTTWKQLDN